MPIYNGDKKQKDIYWPGGIKIGEIYNGATLVYRSAFAVTYVVDSDISYVEMVNPGASVLNPTTFTPAKDGWIFVGWRTDTAADSSVLSSKLCDGEMTLYAVYSQDITKTFVSYDKTEDIVATRYYNASGKISNPTVTFPDGGSYSGWTWRGWSGGSTTNADATALYSAGESVECKTSSTHYGLYQQDITCTFYSWAKTLYETGTRYYNAAGNYSSLDMTVPTGATSSGWTWRGYSAAGDSAGNAAVAYANGDVIANVTSGQLYYGLYQRTLTLSYNGNGSTGGSTASQTATQYVNAIANYVNPKLTLRANGFSKTYYSFQKWAMGSTSGTQYSSGASVTLSENTTFYALWVQSGAAATAKVTSSSSYSDTGWNAIVFNSFSVTPNNNTYFSIDSAKEFITVNKACSVAITLVAKVSGGNPRFVLTKNDSIVQGDFIIDKYESGTYTATVSLTAGTKLSIKAGTTIEGSESSFDSCTLTLKVG